MNSHLCTIKVHVLPVMKWNFVKCFTATERKSLKIPRVVSAHLELSFPNSFTREGYLLPCPESFSFSLLISSPSCNISVVFSVFCQTHFLLASVVSKAELYKCFHIAPGYRTDLILLTWSATCWYLINSKVSNAGFRLDFKLVRLLHLASLSWKIYSCCGISF